MIEDNASVSQSLITNCSSDSNKPKVVRNCTSIVNSSDSNMTSLCSTTDECENVAEKAPAPILLDSHTDYHPMDNHIRTINQNYTDRFVNFEFHQEFDKLIFNGVDYTNMSKESALHPETIYPNNRFKTESPSKMLIRLYDVNHKCDREITLKSKEQLPVEPKKTCINLTLYDKLLSNSANEAHPKSEAELLIIKQRYQEIQDNIIRQEDPSDLNPLIIERIKQLENEKDNIDSIINNKPSKVKVNTYLSNLDNIKVNYTQDNVDFICKIVDTNQINSEKFDIYATGNPEKNNQGSKKFSRTKLTINIKFNQIPVPAELDSGSGFSVIGLQTLMALMPDFQNTCQKIDDPVDLFGVTANKLDIIGTYKIPIYAPVIGLTNVVFRVIKNNILILGKDFLCEHELEIKFGKDFYKIRFPRSKQTIMIYNNNQIQITNKVGQVDFNFKGSKLKKGLYKVSLESAPKGIDMVESLINVRKNKKASVNLITGNGENAVIAEDNCIFKLTPMHKNELIRPENMNFSDLTNLIKLQDSKIQNETLPEDYSYYFEDNKEHTEILKILREIKQCSGESELNSVPCIPCLKSVLNCKTPLSHILNNHKKHDNEELTKERMTTNIEKIHKIDIAQDFELPDDKGWSNCEKENDLGLADGEIGTPHFKTLESIKEMVNKKLGNLPKDIQDILTEPLIRNEQLSRSPWDIPCCPEEMDYDVDPLPRESLTKIYPVRPEYLKSLFGTLQMLLFHNIIEHAPINMSFGSPLFCIKRKPVEGESSRQLRILLDSRICNKYIRGSTSASMVGCLDNLRNIVKNTNFMSSMDLRNMFYSIKQSERVLNTGITQFTTPFGIFRLLRAASGGALSPSFANKTVLKNLHLDSESYPTLLEMVMSFYDDITLGTNESYDMKEHALILANIISRINKMGFQINMEKSTFCVDLRTDSLEILGMKISKNKIGITPKRKADVIENLKTPKSKKELQSLIGLINYLRHLMTSEDLKKLGILSTKLKNNTFVWDAEGEECLAHLKTSLETQPFLINIPSKETIPLLFTDSSDHTVAGILYHLPIDLLQYAPPTLPDIQKSDVLKKHLDEHKIVATPLTEKTSDFLEFLSTIHRHYRCSPDLSINETKNVIIDMLQTLMPQLLSKIDIPNDDTSRHTVFRQFLKDYDIGVLNLDHYSFSRELLLHGLGGALNRQICITLISDNYTSKTPLIKLNSDSKLSPIIVSYHNDTFQLLALQSEFNGLQPYSLLKIDDFSSSDILKIYKGAAKNSQLEFGGVYSFGLPLSYKNVPIFMKEMLALSCSLNYFSPYIKMSRAFVFVDSSTLYHGIRQVRSKSIQKLHRIGLILASTYPLVRMFLVPSGLNPSDYFTRKDTDNFVKTSENMTLKSFVEFCTNEANKELSKDLDVKTDHSHDKHHGFDTINKIDHTVLKFHNNDEINLLGPEIISKSFVDEATMENVKLTTLKNHTSLADGKKYVLKDGLIFHLESGKIFLPEELWYTFILSTHSLIHHQGIKRTERVLKEKFHVKNQNSFNQRIRSLLKSCVACCTSKACFYKPYEYQTNYGQEIMDSLTFDVIESEKFFSPHSNTPIHSVLGIICNVSKFIEVYYLSKGNANEIYNALLSFFSKHRFPRYVHADNASIFRNKKIYGLFEMFNIKFNRSAPQASRSRTFIENSFKQLREASRIFCEHYKGANELIAFILFIKIHNHLPLPIPGIYMTPHIMVNHESSKSFYRQDYKSQLINNYSRRLVIVDNKTLEKEEIDSNLAYERATEIIRKNLDLHRLAINKNRIPHGIKINDIVIPKNFNRARKSMPIFLDDPARVVEVRGSMLILLSLITGIIYNRHVMHVKPINLINKDNLPIYAFEKYTLYSREYIEKLIENTKHPHKQTDKVMTRSESKRQEDDIKRKIEEDDEMAVSFYAIEE